MPRLQDRQSLPFVLNDIDKVLVRNLAGGQIQVEFQWCDQEGTWHEIRSIQLPANDELIAKRTDLWANGMRGDSPVRVGVAGPEGMDIADVHFKMDH